MPELNVTIGGRSFAVACQEGEEHFLRTAAAMLDREAQSLVTQMGRLPESKLLLMAGLLLADRTAAVEDQNRALQARVAELESAATATTDPAAPQVHETLTALATKAEALAATIKSQTP